MSSYFTDTKNLLSAFKIATFVTVLFFAMNSVAISNSLVTGRTKTMYSNDVHRYIQQILMLEGLVPAENIFLEDRRTSNGNWSLTLFVGDTPRMTYVYSVSRIRLFLSPVELAQLMFQRLEQGDHLELL